MKYQKKKIKKKISLKKRKFEKKIPKMGKVAKVLKNKN